MIGFLFGLIWWLIQAIFIVCACFVLIPIAIYLLSLFIGLIFCLIGWIITIFNGDIDCKKK